MQDSQAIQTEYQQIIEETHNSSQQFEQYHQNFLQLLKCSQQSVSQLVVPISDQFSTVINILKTQEGKREALSKQQQNLTTWQHMRATHSNIEKDRQIKLHKTIEQLKVNREWQNKLLEACQKESSSIEQGNQQIRRQRDLGRKNHQKQMENLTNRPLRKGVQVSLGNGLLKITVERWSKEDICVNGLVQYLIKVEHNQYQAAKEYNQTVQSCIKEYNFHRNMDKLIEDLSKVAQN